MTTKEIAAMEQENVVVNGEQTADGANELREEEEGKVSSQGPFAVKSEGERWVNMPACGPGSIREAACERRVLLLRGLPASVKADAIADAYESQPDAPKLVNIQFAGDEHWYLIFMDEDSARKANFILNFDIISVMGHKIRVCFKNSVPLASQRPDMNEGFYGPFGGSAPASHVPSPTPPFPSFFLPHQPLPTSGDVFQQQQQQLLSHAVSDNQQLLASSLSNFNPIQISPQLANPGTIGVNPAILTAALLSQNIQQQPNIHHLLQDAVSLGTSNAQPAFIPHGIHHQFPATALPLNGLPINLASVLGISPVGHFSHPHLLANINGPITGAPHCPNSQQEHLASIVNMNHAVQNLLNQQQRIQARAVLHRHECSRQARNGSHHHTIEHAGQPRSEPVEDNALLYESSSQQPSDYLELGGTFTRKSASTCMDEAAPMELINSQYDENGSATDLLESKVFTPSQTGHRYTHRNECRTQRYCEPRMQQPRQVRIPLSSNAIPPRFDSHPQTATRFIFNDRMQTLVNSYQGAANPEPPQPHAEPHLIDREPGSASNSRVEPIRIFSRGERNEPQHVQQMPRQRTRTGSQCIGTPERQGTVVTEVAGASSEEKAADGGVEALVTNSTLAGPPPSSSLTGSSYAATLKRGPAGSCANQPHLFGRFQQPQRRQDGGSIQRQINCRPGQHYNLRPVHKDGGSR